MCETCMYIYTVCNGGMRACVRMCECVCTCINVWVEVSGYIFDCVSIDVFKYCLDATVSRVLLIEGGKLLMTKHQIGSTPFFIFLIKRLPGARQAKL